MDHWGVEYSVVALLAVIIWSLIVYVVAPLVQKYNAGKNGNGQNYYQFRQEYVNEQVADRFVRIETEIRQISDRVTEITRTVDLSEAILRDIRNHAKNNNHK